MVGRVDPEDRQAALLDRLVQAAGGGQDGDVPAAAQGVRQVGDDDLAAAAVVEGVRHQEQARAAAHRGMIRRHWT